MMSTSDYRGASSPKQTETQPLQYSQVTKQFKYPSKNQAIVLNYYESLTLNEYVKAIAEKVQAKNITHVSRISNNRVCIYLTTKELAENLTNQHKTLTINNTEVEMRMLMTPSKE